MNGKKIAKWGGIGVAVLFLGYVAYVANFEINLGTNQPMGRTSIIIATFNDDGERHERVLRLEQIDGNNYIAANHWPRAWYRQAMRNPEVEIKMPQQEFAPYRAVPLEGAELQRVEDEYQIGFRGRFRMGFPPRRFMRLDPN